ncbi:MAG: hypothetical protein GY718_09960 [Lentisphaerae bacterium]|nr:hypothetical protein [Lentisphaerota bacterium]
MAKTEKERLMELWGNYGYDYWENVANQFGGSMKVIELDKLTQFDQLIRKLVEEDNPKPEGPRNEDINIAYKMLKRQPKSEIQTITDRQARIIGENIGKQITSWLESQCPSDQTFIDRFADRLGAKLNQAKGS